MADSFTANQIQSSFGKYGAVLDVSAVVLTANNVQGNMGRYTAVLDEAAAAAAGGARRIIFIS